jgi:hypothetical protein
MHASARWTAAALLAAFTALTATELAAKPRDPAGWSILRHESPLVAKAPLKLAPVASIVDDGSREADVGFTAAAAFQFLWFNRFDPPTTPGQDFDLEEIQVLFPPGPDVVPGAAVQLVAFSDADGDPASGAVLVTAFDDVIQVVDGTTFSVYPVNPPVRLSPGSGDLLVGVINRFVVSGVSPPSRPAALDTTASAGRSWFALWTGDPPDPPSLPSDDVLATIDAVEPGNWMIRASGSLVAVPAEIPVLGGKGLAALATLIALAAAALLRRRHRGGAVMASRLPSTRRSVAAGSPRGRGRPACATDPACRAPGPCE